MLRQLQLRWSGHLARVDDEWLPKRLFYGDIATGFRQRGDQFCRYKDTLKTSLKRLQTNPANWEDLARDRLSWMRTMKTGAAIYEDHRIIAAKAKRKARRFNCVHLSTPALNHPDLIILPTDVLGANRPCRTFSYQLQDPDYTSCCSLVQPCLILHAKD
ncbi:hypothetical protein SprV_0100212700 [Sparganum proliferum]